MIPGDELILVLSTDEIVPGITIVIRPCPFCGRSHSTVILRILGPGENKSIRWVRSARIYPEYPHWSDDMSLCDLIKKKIVYRLQDLDPKKEALRERKCDVEDAIREITKA